jgi:hypothetical protein
MLSDPGSDDRRDGPAGGLRQGMEIVHEVWVAELRSRPGIGAVVVTGHGNSYKDVERKTPAEWLGLIVEEAIFRR